MNVGLAIPETSRPSSPPTAAPGKTRRSLWIISPFWDLTLLVGSPLAIVPVLIWLGDHWNSPEAISLAVLAFASAGHHLPGFLRAYGERELFRRFKWRFLLAPPAALAVSLAFAWRDLHGLSLVMLFWATWHGLMQAYGFMRIYDMKRGARDGASARLDLALCLAIFAGGVLFSDARVANLAEAFWLAGGPEFDASLVQAARWTCGAAIGVVVLLYVANVVRRGRSLLGVSGAKLALAASTGWLYWLGGALSTNVLIGVAMFEVFHALQYFAIVWVHNCRLARRLGESSGWAAMLFRNRASFLAIYLGAIAAWGAPHFFGGGLLSANALMILSAVYTASAMLHFYFDGFIWKVREPEMQANLGFDSGISKPITASRWRPMHVAKCATLAILLAILAAGEIRSGDKANADESIVLSRLNALTPRLPEVQVRASRLALERGDVAAALKAAQAATAGRPRSHEAHYQLGRALLAEGQPREAATEFEVAGELAPHEWRNHLRLAEARMQIGDWKKAEAALDQASALSRDSPEVQRSLGDLHFMQDDNGAALLHYKRAVRDGSASAETWAALAAAEERDGDTDAAVASLEKAIAIDSRFEFHVRLAEIHRRGGKLESAAACYERALSLNSEAFAAWNNLGAMRYLTGDVTSAAEAWKRAVEIAPDDASAHYNLGNALLELDDFDAAEKELATADKLGFAPPAAE